MVVDRYAGSSFIVDSSNTVIVSAMVEEKGRQTADKKEGRKPTERELAQLIFTPVASTHICAAAASSGPVPSPVIRVTS